MPKIRVKRGPKKVKPHIKRQQRIPKLKSPTERERRLSMPKKANRTHYWVIWLLIQLQVQKRQKDKIGINNIGVFEFIFRGLPEPLELEGIDEDRLRELQNTVQEQLCQRDEERERNITKRE